MHITYDAHAQAVRDRGDALRRAAADERLVARTRRPGVVHRLLCAASRRGVRGIRLGTCAQAA